MKRVLFTAIALLWAASVFAVGSVTVTVASVGSHLTKYTLVWVADGSGDVSGNTTDINIAAGELKQIQYIPGSGGLQPTNLYDVTLVYGTGGDLLISGGVDLSNTTTTFARPTPLVIYDAKSTLDLVVAGAGASNGGTVVLWMETQ